MKKRFLSLLPPRGGSGRFLVVARPFHPQFRPRFSASLASAAACSALPASAWKLRLAVWLSGNFWHIQLPLSFYIKSKVDNLCPP